MNVARFILGGVMMIALGGSAIVFRRQFARTGDRETTRVYGRAWLRLRGRKAPRPSSMIIPGLAGIAIGIANIVQSFP
ncbi:hypothetical protein ASF83_02035 [Plantibacter sp. Leaf171]|uniref:hypothetical protein n=1 Tax=unclassified Plantibacter TaxID=2624265 RepID=UPI0006FB8E1E|nr:MULTISPECIES: hypothetical protein [unclassified Plantibacter]KQM17881.1 hypothetical protein ASE44_02050 [Plantibacter sp. Leaf1]KQR60661.1 hypothetical protein ASF83_02035 [Plantibacter sp. Leaf171]